jgi:hypothetical protein
MGISWPQVAIAPKGMFGESVLPRQRNIVRDSSKSSVSREPHPSRAEAMRSPLRNRLLPLPRGQEPRTRQCNVELPFGVQSFQPSRVLAHPNSAGRSGISGQTSSSEASQLRWFTRFLAKAPNFRLGAFQAGGLTVCAELLLGVVDELQDAGALILGVVLVDQACCLIDPSQSFVLFARVE